jgi:hypothetical protein
MRIGAASIFTSSIKITSFGTRPSIIFLTSLCGSMAESPGNAQHRQCRPDAGPLLILARLERTAASEALSRIFAGDRYATYLILDVVGR